MTLILGLLKVFPKIRNEIFGKILYIITRVHDIICILSFFTLPFVKFPKTVRLVFLITWIYTCLVIWGGYLFFSYRAKDKLKDYREEYTRDKIVYWISEIGMCLCMAATFLLIFIERNYASKFSLFEIIAFFALIVFFVSALSKLFASYKNNYKQLARDTILSLLILLCILSVAIGVIAHNTEHPFVDNILIAMGAFPLAIGGLYAVCKTFLVANIESKKPDTFVFSILLFVGIGIICGIILRYMVTDQYLQQILTTIFAAVLGGVITLAGVAWTIKDGNSKREKDLQGIELSRQEEDKKKNKPYLCLDTTGNNKIKIDIKQSGYNLGVQVLTDVIFIFKGVILDGTFIEAERLIPQKESFRIEINIKDYENVSFIGCDVLDNYYKFDLEFYMISNDKIVKSIGLPKEINIKDIQV